MKKYRIALRIMLIIIPIAIVLVNFIKLSDDIKKTDNCFENFVFFVTPKEDTTIYYLYGERLLVAEYNDNKPSNIIRLIGVFKDGSFQNIDNQTTFDEVVLLRALDIKEKLDRKGFQQGQGLYRMFRGSDLRHEVLVDNHFIKVSLSRYWTDFYLTYNDKDIRVFSYGYGNSYGEEYDHVYEVNNGKMNFIRNNKTEIFSKP